MRDAESDYLMLPGGGVQFEETAVEALTRQVFEETGYRILVGTLLTVRENMARRLGHARPRADRTGQIAGGRSVGAAR